jgi:hypothetical protein
LWIYLHKNRPLDYPAWKEHLGKSDGSDNKIEKSEKNEKSLSVTVENSTPVKKKKGENFLKNKRKHS